MRDDLVPEEIEIDPFFCGTALGASQEISIECTRLGEVAYGEGKMESGPRRHGEWFLMATRERSRLAR